MNTLGDVIAKRTGTSFAPNLGFEPPEWTLAAVCPSVDPDLFFPEKDGSTRAAKLVCIACPVRSNCLTFAMDHGERFGIFGGLSERERRALASKGWRAGDPIPAVRTPPRRVRETCTDCGAEFFYLDAHRAIKHPKAAVA